MASSAKIYDIELHAAMAEHHADWIASGSVQTHPTPRLQAFQCSANNSYLGRGTGRAGPRPELGKGNGPDRTGP